MSNLKFSVDLFLEKQELQRFKKFLDDDGFRYFLLANSSRFGLINKQFSLSKEAYTINGPSEVNIAESLTVNNPFTNGLCQEIGGLLLQYNDIAAIDSNGNLIYKKLSTIEIPNDNNWYWLKIKHEYSNKEVGTFSIDQNGNVVGVNSLLTEVLRGEPNFPSRIKFPNSQFNTLEYDVLEVIDDQNIILNGTDFIAETGLELVVVGTFTPDSVPPSIDKDIFNYDSCEISLDQEIDFNTRPTYVDGIEFFLCRVKNTGSQLIVQDKRNDIWKTKSDHLLSFIDKKQIPFFGVEKIKYSNSFTPKDKNRIYVSWTLRTSNYTIDTNLNKFTISDGKGGKGKTINDFPTGYFDGWRLYTKDGNYSIITSSVKSGSQMNLVLDILDIDKFSNDGGTTILQDEIIIAPDAEEIEIICTALNNDASESIVVNNEGSLADQRFVFPINTSIAYFELIVFDNPNCQYQIQYRLKSNFVYSLVYNMTSDLQFGYYTEFAFDDFAEYLEAVNNNNYSENVTAGYISKYTGGIITLNLHPNSYSNFVFDVTTGDLLGVERRKIAPTTREYNVELSVNRQYQYFEDGTVQYTLEEDKFIILKPGIRNGNFFLLHIKQLIKQDNAKNYTLRIVQDYIDPTNYSTLKEFNYEDFKFLNEFAYQGLIFRCTWDGSTWIIDSVNETQFSGEWIDYVLPYNSMFCNDTVDFYFATIAPTNPDYRHLRYKIQGKVATIQIAIRNANFSATNISQFFLKLPSILKPKSGGYQQNGFARWNNNEDPGYTNMQAIVSLVSPSTPSTTGKLYGSGSGIYGRAQLLVIAKLAEAGDVVNYNSGTKLISLGESILRFETVMFHNLQSATALDKMEILGTITYELD